MHKEKAHTVGAKEYLLSMRVLLIFTMVAMIKQADRAECLLPAHNTAELKIAAEYFIVHYSFVTKEKEKISGSSGADDEGAREIRVNKRRDRTGILQQWGGWAGKGVSCQSTPGWPHPPALKKPMGNGSLVGPGTASTVAAAGRGVPETR